MYRSGCFIVLTVSCCQLMQATSWAGGFGLVSSGPTRSTQNPIPESVTGTEQIPTRKLELEPVQLAPSIQFKQNENGGIAPTLELFGKDGFAIAPNRNFIYSFEVKIQDSTAERSAEGAVETFELFGGDIEVSFNMMYEYVRSSHYGAQASLSGIASLINGPAETTTSDEDGNFQIIDTTNISDSSNNTETLVYQAQLGFGLWLRYAYLGFQYSYNQTSKSGGAESVSRMIDGSITRRARLIVPLTFNQSAESNPDTSSPKYFLRLEHARGENSDRENTSLTFTTSFDVF